MTDPLAETRHVIRYTDPAEYLRAALAHAEKLGLVHGTGKMYNEGRVTFFTERTSTVISRNGRLNAPSISQMRLRQ